MASHGESMPSVVLDNKDAIHVAEALTDELQVDDGIRHYKKGMWTVSELLVLQAVRREDFERQAKGGSREKHRVENGMWRESPEVAREHHNRSAHERWKWMEDRCWMQGVQRSAGQCQDKWEGITAGFKKVNDYEKQLTIGQPSYWQLGSDDKKKLRLPPNFHKEVFTALQEWYVKSRTGEPGVLFDALAPSRGVASNMDFSGSAGESDENDAGPISSGKRRRSGPSKFGSMDGIAAVLERNNRNIVDALRLAEDRKDNRHKQTLQFEREKHRDLIELQKQLGSGYITALNRIGDALDKFAMAMQASSRH